ncbi:MAG TPA: DUF2905 domain-containing protein [Vicinamibacteria bacterium]|nr:DUF2905 domain-containing protein [Vicinamibacteria bacterium]
MRDLTEFGRWLIAAGAVLAGLGVILLLVGRVPAGVRLPGDVVVRRGNFTFYFPLATSILLSLLLTLLFSLFRR